MLVVFCGTGHFDHCFIVVEDKGQWLRFDGSYGRPKIETLGTEDPTPVFEKHGFTVVSVEPQPGWMISPIALFTCVALVKRFLGISNPLILTARQLYRYLTR